MELRVLKYFLAVAREENISKAADVVYVTQPTLSRQIMDLEEELGTTLLIRGTRKISLTESGTLLRKRAEEIMELVHKTEAELRAPDEIISGDIYIGGGETDAVRIIAQIARDLQREYPHIKVNIQSGDAADISERIDKGLIDFGVLIELNPNKYESLTLPAYDTWGVLMRRDSPLAARESISPEDLWDEPLILSRQSLAGSEIPRWLKRDIDKLNVVATYNLVYNASLLVEEGMGCALTLDKLVRIPESGPLCFRPLNPALESSLYIVWKKYQVFSRASAIFLERLRKTLE